jgi:hypothetical protein
MSTMHRDMVIHFAPSSVIVANGESVLRLLGREYKNSWPPPHPCKARGSGPFTASLAASKLQSFHVALNGNPLHMAIATMDDAFSKSGR